MIYTTIIDKFFNNIPYRAWLNHRPVGLLENGFERMLGEEDTTHQASLPGSDSSD